MLKIGISEVDITPAPGLRMAGMLNPPKAEGVHFLGKRDGEVQFLVAYDSAVNGAPTVFSCEL